MFSCSCSLVVHWASLRWLLEFFVRQFVDLYFFRVDYRNFILFLWWCHVSLILHNSCGHALISAHLKKQSTSSSLYRLASAGKALHQSAWPEHGVWVGWLPGSTCGQAQCQTPRMDGPASCRGWGGRRDGPAVEVLTLAIESAPPFPLFLDNPKWSSHADSLRVLGEALREAGLGRSGIVRCSFYSLFPSWGCAVLP